MYNKRVGKGGCGTLYIAVFTKIQYDQIVCSETPLYYL